jgi:CelD/BcsL family acetyltransferase involved in cellulose biosynthesis
MIQAEVLRPTELSPGDLAAWRSFCAMTPAFANPLLGPDFAMLMDRARDDARVAVFRRAGETIGFLAFHRRPSGFARPIGAAFGDYHAIISPPDERFDAREALAAAKISAFRFAGLIDPHGLFDGAGDASCPGYVLTAETLDAYAERLREANPKFFKNVRRLHNKLEREWGEIVLTPGDTSQDAFDQLMAWKRDQFRRTGCHDVFGPEWTSQLFQTVFEMRDGRLQGAMSTLRAGGRLVAGHFGPRLGKVWHGWISAMDPDASSCGPGLVMMLQVPEIMQALGLKAYDMGRGHDHYKAPFAGEVRQTYEGLAVSRSLAGLAAGSLERAWEIAGRDSAAMKLHRRLDQIAAVELSVGGRVQGVVGALAGYGRRTAHKKAISERAAEAPPVEKVTEDA